MNKIFKIVWNAARGKMMVVNEATSSVQTGKKAAVTVAVIGALVSGTALAAEPSVFELKDNVQAELLSDIQGLDLTAENVVVKGSGAETMSFNATAQAAKPVVSVVGNKTVTIQNLSSLTVLGTTYQSGPILSSTGASVVLDNIDSVTFGAADNYLEDYGLNATSGEIKLTNVGELNIYANTNAVMAKNDVGGNGATNVEISADKISVQGTGYPVFYSHLDDAATSTDKVALKVAATTSLTVEADGQIAALYDSVTGSPAIAGHAPISHTYEAETIKFTSNENAALRINKVAENCGEGDSAIIAVTASGLVDIYGKTSAAKFTAKNADNKENVGGTITGQNIVLKSEGAVVDLTNSFLNLQAKDTVTVESKNHTGIKLNNSNVTVTAAKATFTTDSDYYGIDAQNGSTATIDADVIEASSAYAGVISRASNVTLGNDQSSLVKIEAKGQGYQGKVIGLWAYDPSSSITVKGQNLEIVAKGDEGVTSYGILAQPRVGAGETGDNRIVVEAQNAVIDADTGILAMGKGQVDVKGNLTVNATNNAILARGESTVNINQAGGKDVVLNGDINFNKDATSGTNAWADVNVKLDTANSVWNGSTKGSWDMSATADDFTNSNLNLTLANGAKWINKDIATSGVLGTDTEGTTLLAVNTLELVGGTLDLSASTQDVTVKGEVSGTGTLVVDTEKSGALVNNGKDSVELLTIETVQTADDVTAEEAEALKYAHTDGIKNVAVKVAEGQVQGAIVVGADGEVEQAVNSKTEALADKVWLAPNMITRIMMNDVRKRMGDLRAAEGTHGVWARYNGGQMSGSGVDADFSMVQVGIDTVPVVDAPRFGVAFSYAETESKDNLGTTDMDSFSLAFYGTKMYDNGMFVDVIGRMATMDSDIVNAGAKGKMDNVALSLSGELGWRFDVTDRFFFEPSAELTYTYTNADTFTMTNGGKYELEAMDSLVGRAGFAAGFKCPANKGDVYVRAAVVHEFMGDATINSWTANGAATPIESDGKDTWFEYAIGAQFNVNKNTYVYADIERTEGATMDEDWRANVGVRFAF